MFQGFSQDTIQFFLDIRFHNEASYFHENKHRYEKVKAEFASLIQGLEPCMQEVDEQMDFRPGKALARLRRDVRFSKDKTPYRDHLWFLLRRAGEEREGSPMFWFELGIDKATLGVGVWGEPKTYYDMLRKELQKNPKPLGKILKEAENNGYTLYGNRLKRIAIPTGIVGNLEDAYRAKSFYMSKEINPYAMVFEPKLLDYLCAEYKKLFDFYKFARTITDKVRMENQ